MKQTTSSTPDALIVGGGLIGMLCARALHERGLRVTLVERGETGRESSWAGGGILSPLYPWRYPAAVSTLAQWSQAVYPALCEDLASSSGVDPQYTRSGLLIIDADEEQQVNQWASEYKVHLERPGRASVQLAPELSAQLPLDGVAWLPEVAQVRNPRLVQALRLALEARGVAIMTGTEVSAIQHTAGRVSGVLTRQGETLSAGQVVIAGGAWSAGLLADTGLQLPVIPVKGQMMLFRAEAGQFGPIILYKDHYVIPRRDGRVLVGSTLERVGFDKTTTAQAREELLAAAFGMVPALAHCPVEQHWAGLRPGSPDGVPFIGQHPEIQGLFVNAGHFRNGVVLGPASAEVLASQLTGTDSELDAAPYDPALLF
jgi:glycine oxidase